MEKDLVESFGRGDNGCCSEYDYYNAHREGHYKHFLLTRRIASGQDV